MTVDTSAAQTLSGVISGTGALTKSSTGTLTLSGTNTYTGGTTLNAGTLIVSGNEAIGTGTLTLAGGTLRTDSTASTINEAIVVSGTTAVFRGSAGLTLSGDISGAGTLNFGGSGSGQANGWFSVNDNLDGFTGTISFEAAGSGNYLLFGGAVNTAAKLELSGVTNGTYIGLQSTNKTFGELSGTGGRIRAWNKTLTINQSTDTTFAGVLEDINGNNELGFTKGGTGSLTFTGANSYEWDTIVNGGTLEVQGSINETERITVNNGATFKVTGTGSLGSAGTYSGGGSGSGDIVINNASFFEYSSNADQAFTGAISGTGTLTKGSTSTLSLSGVSSFSGPTVITGGTLSITGAGQLGSGTYAGAIANSATLTFATSADQTLSGVISGTGALTKSSTGTLTLSGTNTYTGNTTIGAGTLSVTGAGQLGSGTYAGAIANSATLTFATSADQTLSGVISGTGALNKSSTGTLTLSNTNTYNGLTTATAGTLDVTGSIGGALTVNGGTVTTDASGSVAGALTMTTGSISPGTRTSNGTLNVTGNSTWTGGTYVWSVSGGMADSGSNASSGGSDTYNEASGTLGTDWDYMAFTGSLDFDGASAGSITIDIDSNGTYTGYDWDKATEVKIIGAASIANFDASFFNLDSSGFDDATGSWWVDWGIAHHDNALWLQYEAVPEPGTYVMIFGLVMLPIYHWRKKRKVSIRSISYNN